MERVRLIRIHGFEDIVKIGNGGFADVYKAHEIAFDRIVAIKVIRPSAEGSEVAFDRERKAIGALTGVPGIVPVYSSGYTDDGSLYMVMQFVPRSLADLIHGLSLDQAIAWMVAIAEGVDRAHSAGIIHRDIKPANVLVTEGGVPLISDFGLARVRDITHSSSHSFTPSFSAPEVLRGLNATVADDVYSLGATLFNIVSGGAPFAGTTVEERDIFAQILRCSTEPVKDLRLSGIPDAVCVVVERAMAKEAAQRMPTAAQFARDLADASDEMAMISAVADETVVIGGLGSEPPSEEHEPRKPRRRLGAVGLAVNLTVIAGLVVGLVWFQSRGSETQSESRVESLPSVSESRSTRDSIDGGVELDASSSSRADVETAAEVSSVTSRISTTISAFEAASTTTQPATTDATATSQFAPAPATTVAPTPITTAPILSTTAAPTEIQATATTTTTVPPTTTTQGPISVPSVTGFNGSQAVAVLAQAGLISSCDTRCGDVVTGTNPGQGSIVPADTTIALRY